jgi:hypothetical protein
MPISDNARAVAALQRKLRALAAVFSDPAATEAEKSNAQRLKARLEDQLDRETPAVEVPPVDREAHPEKEWTSLMFRLGQGVRDLTSAPAPKGDWTDHAFRLGRMFRKGLKK